MVRCSIKTISSKHLFTGIAALLLLAAAAVYFIGNQKLIPQNSVTLSFVGDVMLSRGVQTALDKYGYDYPYENTAAIFLNDDFIIGNLECFITSFNNPVHKNKRFLFKADP